MSDSANGGQGVADSGLGWIAVNSIGEITTVELIGEFDIANLGVVTASFAALGSPPVVVIDDALASFVGIEATRALIDEIGNLVERDCLVRLRLSSSVLRRLIELIRPDLVELFLRDR